MKRVIPNFERISAQLQAALKPELPPAPPHQVRTHLTDTVPEIIGLIEAGYNQQDACKAVGVNPGSFGRLKWRREDIREAVNNAIRKATKAKQERQEGQEAELRRMKLSLKAAQRPVSQKLPKDINFIRHWLATRVPLDVVDIPRQTIEEACTHYGTDFARWLLYDERFQCMRWVYGRRAKIRGEHLLGKQGPRKLEATFKIDPQYGKIRADSGARIRLGG